MNIAMIQSRNGYNQYYFACDSTFFEANLARPRPDRGQTKANLSRPSPMPKFWPRGLNITGCTCTTSWL